jgi:hypothetical protein
MRGEVLAQMGARRRQASTGSSVMARRCGAVRRKCATAAATGGCGCERHETTSSAAEVEQCLKEHDRASPEDVAAAASMKARNWWGCSQRSATVCRVRVGLLQKVWGGWM